MPWWLWILFGFVLLGLEMVFAGLHVGFFGVGAIAVGFLVAVGAGGPLWLQFLLFTTVSIASLALFRNPIRRRWGMEGPGREIDTLVGEPAAPTEPIAAGARGKVELRGTSWNAENVSDAPLVSGQRCIVERVEGLTLFIRPDRS